MKTSVEKLYFDWQDPNTGEMPKSYQIQVHDLASSRDGDLMTHRLVKLLHYHGDKVINFPKVLLTEIYHDCCWAFAGSIYTGGVLDQMGKESFAATTRNYTRLPDDKWAALTNLIADCMRLRIIANLSRYLEIVLSTPMPEDLRKEFNQDEYIVQAQQRYLATGDWVLELEDKTRMPDVALALLGLRRSFWKNFRINSSKFEPAAVGGEQGMHVASISKDGEIIFTTKDDQAIFSFEYAEDIKTIKDTNSITAT